MHRGGIKEFFNGFLLDKLSAGEIKLLVDADAGT
jgi:hypothetical protein